jgi:hypothetical protein
MPMKPLLGRFHAHPCGRCKVDVLCSGELERNYDGEPEIICTSYHLPYGRIADLQCETCAAESKAEQLREAGEHA